MHAISSPAEKAASAPRGAQLACLALAGDLGAKSITHRLFGHVGLASWPRPARQISQMHHLFHQALHMHRVSQCLRGSNSRSEGKSAALFAARVASTCSMHTMHTMHMLMSLVKRGSAVREPKWVSPYICALLLAQVRSVPARARVEVAARVTTFANPAAAAHIRADSFFERIESEVTAAADCGRRTVSLKKIVRQAHGSRSHTAFKSADRGSAGR